SLRSKQAHMKKREFAWQIITYNLEKLSQSIKALLKLLTKATIMNNAEIRFVYFKCPKHLIKKACPERKSK
ncbi:MAG: hypothetical protein ABIC91_07610, partial [Nanoarchaeota archaeon]|nr:hypothetical protein [Nanoarchaeota archaeon]MBU1031245.1 hypothetical protein [Nanoarchaeota archaeon]MBU1849586.1 hypothetical protein [Nanoarchaeota archaeon]